MKKDKTEEEVNASEFPVSIRFDRRDIKTIPLDADSDSRLFSWGIERTNDFLSNVDEQRMFTDKGRRFKH